MEDASKPHKFPKKEKLFDCADSIESLKCLQCASFETHNLVHLNYHSKAGHTLPDSETKPYKCESCKFTTHSQFISLIHRLLDLCTRGGKIKSEAATPGEIVATSKRDNLCKCEHCPYTTKTPHNLKSHILFKHTAPDKIQWFECARCSHKSKTKYSLKQHMERTHGKRRFMKCAHCAFQTKHKNSLKGHILSQHTDPAHIQWFRCAQCPYKSLRRDCLRRHMTSTSKRSLARNLLGEYSGLDEVKLFCCEHCPYQSTIKENLLQHKRETHPQGKIR